jgi:hypothetical protein
VKKLLLLAGLGVAVVAATVTGVVLTRTADTVATVAGHDVTRDELVFHMRLLSPAVQDEIRNEFRLPGAVDWGTAYGGKTGLQRLSAAALDRIRADKVAFVVAREQGIDVAIDYPHFLDELAAENKRRANAVAKGEVVYGVTEFSPDEYYSHRLTEVKTALAKRLALPVSDNEVKAAFAADREAWSANATTYTYSRLVVPLPDGDRTDLRQRVAGAKRLADVASAGTLTRATWSGGGLNTHDQDLAAVLGKLAPGQISAPVPGTGQVTYYQLDGRRVDEAKAFAAYAGRIRQSLAERKFGQYLQRRVDASPLRADTAAVTSITREDLQ